MIWADTINKWYLNSNLLKLKIVSLSYMIFHGLSSVELLFCGIDLISDSPSSLMMLRAQQSLKACGSLNLTVFRSPGARFLSEANPKIQSCRFLNWQEYSIDFFYLVFVGRGWRDTLAFRKEADTKNGWHVLVFVTLFLAPNQTWENVC